MPTGVYPRSEQTKRKMSEARKGIKLSKETKRKISEAHKSEEHRRKISQLWSEERKRKYSERVKGNKNPAWKGERKIIPKGYVLLFRPNHPNRKKRGYVQEHRLVMEAHLGRYLTRSEVVHHRNNDKEDNRISNLRLFKNESEHNKWHARQRQETKLLMSNFRYSKIKKEPAGSVAPQ